MPNPARTAPAEPAVDDLAAAPYPGGDPYADYRPADFAFTALPDLADRRLGGAVLAAGDEFFADRENLLKPDPAEFRPHTFTAKGQLMDGWETRRRRGRTTGAPHPGPDDHDWALIRLGVPGTVRGVLVDTAHFRGNHPLAVSVEATELPGTPGPEDLDAADWHPLVPRSPVRGHAANGYPVTDPRRVTHLRIRQYPDGGIARLRVHGEPRPDRAWLTALGTFDLAALAHGGTVEDASDRFFSSPVNLIMPGTSRVMGEGWETRRRRDRGADWVRLRLAGRGLIRAVEIDTANYLGNAAGWAGLQGRDGEDGAWFDLLPLTRLQPDTLHRLPLDRPRPATHVRLDVLPDGGIARLRLHGSLL
ncbi:allantoicase [Kitasatospora paracochleata]|uniref:Probable allantoicase n=1 Tax=Kitasatospora paracochleata TaxID=58354 RepID=A0ABT1J7A1_9ACTN|nr:allantoicase [Kitasatospora paracochleata]MCP2313307.1 allantoicase [Kitasatospora paracochleata]